MTAEDALCRRRIISAEYGEILATYDMDHGPMIALYNTRDELTRAEAVVLARAILAWDASIPAALEQVALVGGAL